MEFPNFIGCIRVVYRLLGLEFVCLQLLTIGPMYTTHSNHMVILILIILLNKAAYADIIQGE